MTIEEFSKKLQLDEETKSVLEQFVNYRQQEVSTLRTEGIQRAQERGVKFGRPRIEKPKLHSICQRYLAGELTLNEATCLSGVSRSTLWRRAREYAKKSK